MALVTKPLEKVRKDVPVQEVVEAKPEKMARVNFEVPPEVRTAWRAEALRRGKPLSELLRSAMDEYLSK